jgi:hypothetical protein
MSFKHLQRYDVEKKTVPFTFYQIAGEPIVECLPATEANRPYHNALLKRNAKLAQRFRAGRISREMLEKSRDEDRELYAKFVVKGWRNVKDDNGADVPFTQEAAAEFFEALPNWLFDELRVWASSPGNFVDEDAESLGEEEVDDLAGN